MNIIEVKDLNKKFVNGKQEAHILKNINLTVEKGEFVSIMGPSGSGKSTLLYLLGGLDKPTTGSVKIEGTDISTLSDKQLCSMRNDKLMISGANKSDYKDKLNECLEIIGMKDKRKLTPRELSGGQQQRVAIARALVFDPEILFLDEPIGNLDTKTGMKIMDLFRKINHSLGMTIVQVTHSEKSAEYGTKLVKLVDGEIDIVKDIDQITKIA